MEEVLCLAFLFPLAEAYMRAQVHPELLCSDATLPVAAGCKTKVTEEEALRVYD